jgi:hypothetical protein
VPSKGESCNLINILTEKEWNETKIVKEYRNEKKWIKNEDTKEIIRR